MKGHGTKFGRKKDEVLAALLSCRSIDEAARASGLATNTVLRWMQEPEFAAALRAARRAAFDQAVTRLHQASGAAVSSVLKIMLDGNGPASTRFRAAAFVLDNTSRAIELEGLEARVAELEHAAEAAQTCQDDG
jgi:hypothetical protein